MDVKVLGPGCAKCKEAEKVVRETVTELGVEAHVEKVTDFQKIAEYGVLGTPAVVVNGQVKCMGKVPSKEDLKKWLSV
jgi:small redox-active disulfide protein 2